jgi:uncharacterized protein (TIGR03437 family)
MRLSLATFFVLAACGTASAQSYSISTFAGGALPVNISGTSATLYGPQSVAVDAKGNVFFADQNDVLRVDATTGMLSLVAGNGTAGYSGDDGLAVDAQLNLELNIVGGGGLALDTAGNLYIADTGNQCIRKVTNGVITTVAGTGTSGFSGDNGPATSAKLSGPAGVGLDSAQNLYIADTGNRRIRKVSNGIVTTVAGGGTGTGDNGPAASASLFYPEGVAFDQAGNMYIADFGASRIRKVSNGVITTVAGNGTLGFSGDNGPAVGAGLNEPEGVAVDAAGNIYIADYFNNRVRKVSNGVITTVTASVSLPAGVAADAAGNVYIADRGNGRIRGIVNDELSTLAGGGSFIGEGGPATSAQFHFSIASLTADSGGNLYISDTGNNLVHEVLGGTIAVLAGAGTPGFSGDYGPAIDAQLSSNDGIAVDSAGGLYVSDSGNNRVRKVSGGIITTVAGTGTPGFSGDGGLAVNAQLQGPSAVAVDNAGNLYIADSGNSRIRKVSNGVISTIAGTGTAGYSGDYGPAIDAETTACCGMAVDSTGSLYFIEDLRVRRIANGIVTTVAGGGSAAGSGDNGPATKAMLFPAGVAVDADSNLYISDNWSRSVRKVVNGVITTIAGGGSAFGDGGPATSALLYQPGALAVGPLGEVYLADTYDNRIRLLTPNAKPAIHLIPGIVSGFGEAMVQPGSWVSIYGANLASGTSVWHGEFPISLNGVSVSIDGRPAYLWYISPTQINLQVPDDSNESMVSVAVTTPSGTSASRVTLVSQAPSFSLLGDGRHVAAEIATPKGMGAYGGGTYDLAGPSNTFSFNTRPVRAGETLVLYGVGFGATNPFVPAGQPHSGAAPVSSAISVSIGGVNANVGFAGITEAGLYQINVTVPNVVSGDQPVQAIVNGAQSSPGAVVTIQ